MVASRTAGSIALRPATLAACAMLAVAIAALVGFLWRLNDEHWGVNDAFFLGAVTSAFIAMVAALTLCRSNGHDGALPQVEILIASGAGVVLFFCALCWYLLLPPSVWLFASRSTRPSGPASASVTLQLRHKGLLAFSNVVIAGVAIRNQAGDVEILSASPMLAKMTLQDRNGRGESLWVHFGDGTDLRASAIENMVDFPATVVKVPNERDMSDIGLHINRHALIPGESVVISTATPKQIVVATTLRMMREQGSWSVLLASSVGHRDAGGGIFDASGNLVGLTVGSDNVSHGVRGILFRPSHLHH